MSLRGEARRELFQLSASVRLLRFVERSLNHSQPDRELNPPYTRGSDHNNGQERSSDPGADDYYISFCCDS